MLGTLGVGPIMKGPRILVGNHQDISMVPGASRFPIHPFLLFY